MKTYRIPKPVGSLQMPLNDLAETIFLKIRRTQHAPVHIFIRGEEVFALSSSYNSCVVWDAQYPEDCVAKFTWMERPYQIKIHLQRAIDARKVAETVDG